MMERKSILVSEETHKRLADIGRKSETYDQLINRLIDIAEGKTRGTVP